MEEEAVKFLKTIRQITINEPVAGLRTSNYLTGHLLCTLAEAIQRLTVKNAYQLDTNYAFYCPL